MKTKIVITLPTTVGYEGAKRIMRKIEDLLTPPYNAAKGRITSPAPLVEMVNEVEATDPT